SIPALYRRQFRALVEGGQKNQGDLRKGTAGALYPGNHRSLPTAGAGHRRPDCRRANSCAAVARTRQAGRRLVGREQSYGIVQYAVGEEFKMMENPLRDVTQKRAAMSGFQGPSKNQSREIDSLREELREARETLEA